MARALSVEGPAVVPALQPLANHASAGEPHTAVWTAIIKGADLTRASSKERDFAAMQSHELGLAPQSPGRKNRMPVIQHSHGAKTPA